MYKGGQQNGSKANFQLAKLSHRVESHRHCNEQSEIIKSKGIRNTQKKRVGQKWKMTQDGEGEYG
jgi:hypothetical protein